jgi:CRP-like cAMP-binding protein
MLRRGAKTMADDDSLIVRLKNLPAVRALGRREVERRIAAEREGGMQVPERASAWALTDLALWQLIPDDEAIHLRSVMRTRDYQRRETGLLSEDDGRVWIVLEGGVKLCRVGALGRRLVEALLEPGDVFGRLTKAAEMETYELQALQASRVASVARGEFTALLERNPELCCCVIQDLEDRQRKLVRRLESLAFKDVRVRVAESLLELSTEHGEPCQHGFAVDLRITQQDLAELVGASRQMVNRVLGELSRELYVQRMGRVICVLDAHRLERYVDALAS